MATSAYTRMGITGVTEIEPWAEIEHDDDEPEAEVVLTLSTEDASITFRDTPGNLRTFLEAALRAIEEPEDVPF